MVDGVDIDIESSDFDKLQEWCFRVDFGGKDMCLPAQILGVEEGAIHAQQAKGVDGGDVYEADCCERHEGCEQQVDHQEE